jgi:hypothetical protein
VGALDGDRRNINLTGAERMKIELSQTPLLSPQQIGELASSLDALHTRVLKTIERLQKDVDARKSLVANRWKNSDFSPQERARFAERETAAAVREIQVNARDELNRFYKEAGPIHAQLVAQRPYYDSPVEVLSRAALGTAQRSAYLEQLAHAGPGELGHIAQVAVGTKNVALAAAVLSLVDAKPRGERPVSGPQLAAAMELEDFAKVEEYFKIGQARLQGIVLAIRSWMHGKSNPISTVSLALLNREVDFAALVNQDD